LEEKKYPKLDKNQKNEKRLKMNGRKYGRNPKNGSSINFENEVIFYDLKIFVFDGMNDHQSR